LQASGGSAGTLIYYARNSNRQYGYVCFQYVETAAVPQIWIPLGCAGSGSSGPITANRAFKSETVALGSPTEIAYELTGVNLPTDVDLFIRAQGFLADGALAEESIWEDYLLAPSAANVSVSGRVMTAEGQGLRNAVVTLTLSGGAVHTARTGSFGYYRFDDIEVGQNVIVSVRSKLYQFQPRVIPVTDDLTNVDFTPMGGDLLRK
jgi:hypothetical protein